MTYPVEESDIAAFRRFNRFHTRLVGALNNHFLKSEFSLPQGRVLYELAHESAGLSATALGETLGMDKGFLSRILSGLERNGLIRRSPSAANAKRLELSLTQAGRKAFAKLDRDSAAETRARLKRLRPAAQKRLVRSLDTAESLLSGTDSGVTLRDPLPGEIALAMSQQAKLYAAEYGWTDEYEALAMEIAAKFIREFKPERERCWIAEVEGEIAGAVFLVRVDDGTAKLRLLHVEPHTRGMGIGRRLVAECIAFARQSGYRELVLWTNDVLVSARRIYEAAGFKLIEEERHHSFGKDLVGQNWRLEL
jgi:DNA-binding MarR family transcriptional regulator/GNAT superfamily N-acetyltransferase